MLDQRGQLLVALVVCLAIGGLLLDLPAALLVAIVLASATVREVRRLRSASSHGTQPWGLRARVAPPRVVATTRQRRSHRVGQRVELRLMLSVPAEFAGAWLQIDGFETTAGIDVLTRSSSLRLTGEQEIALVARADTAAVHRLHGVRLSAIDALGLVRAQFFIPCPYEVAVLPRSLPLDLRHLPETRRNVRRAVGGNRPDRVPGQGDELRELREHMPGDPFKHIAWKASARRGRMMSRVFEHERARSLYVVFDTGATMRQGKLGQTPLDAGLDLVHSLAERSARQNLPFGMSLVDGVVVDRLMVREGLAAVQACDRALLNVRRAVAAYLSPLPEDALFEVVARYLRAVEGVTLPEPTTNAAWLRRRQRTVMAALARLPERERLPALRGPEPSSRTDLAILRRYCRAADLALPYRGVLSPDDRIEGLISGLKVAMAARKGPFVTVLVSDFAGLRGALEPLWQAIGRARSRGHRVLLISLTEPVADVLDLIDNVDDMDTARGLAKADQAARAQLIDALAQGARRSGASFVSDPQPHQIALAWQRVAFS